MNELRGQYVNIVLGLEEGRGMDFLKYPAYIVAHFNGRVMESDCVDPDPSPDFNTELVWETEKKVIRKVRSTNSPLRVECFTTDTYGNKECIGFTLLSLRSANIVPSNKPDMQIPIKWYKLIGVPPAYKKSHPELGISLTLRDQMVSSTVPPALSNFPTDSNQSLHSEEKLVIPIRFIDGGFIQIGNDDSKADAYDLNISVKVASNLDLLLPKDIVFAPTKEKFYLVFSMFGISINSKPFYRDLHETIVLNENVVLKLLANFEILKLFFGHFYQAHIWLYYGNIKLASTKINMEKLIPDIEQHEFKGKYKGVVSHEEVSIFESEFSEETTNENPTDRQACIQVETCLCVEKEKSVKVSENKAEPVVTENPVSDTNAAGDQNKQQTATIYEQRCKAETPVLVTKPAQQQDPCQIINSYSQYSLDIILESIIWRKQVQKSIYHVKFIHPRASTCLLIKAEIENVLGRNILLESLHCKLFYVSTPTKIQDLVNDWSPKIIIEDETGQPISEEFTINTEQLFDQDVQESSYSVVLNCFMTDEILADVRVWTNLKECGLKSTPQINYELSPQVLDESLVLKELVELEQWKNDIKTNYENELKAKEKMQLNNLMESWTERKNDLEKKLTQNVERCKAISKELQKANNALKIEQTLKEKQQAESAEDLQEAIRMSTVKYSICDITELVQKICMLEKENGFLKDMMSEQTQEINSIKKYALSNEQTANLLQEVRTLEEKLSEAQKAKGYFKEQYAKAVKEIHDLKTEGQKNIQNQIQSKKDELSQLSLDKFFDSQSSDAYKFSENVLNSDIFGDKQVSFSSDDINRGYVP